MSTLDMSQGTKNVYHIHMFIVVTGKHTGKEVYLKFTCFRECNL